MSLWRALPEVPVGRQTPLTKAAELSAPMLPAYEGPTDRTGILWRALRFNSDALCFDGGQIPGDQILLADSSTNF